MQFESSQGFRSDRGNNCREVISDADLCIALLEATNHLASVLLSDEDLDSGVNKALEILGRSIKADRLTLNKHYDDCKGETLGCVIVEYEWLAAGTDSQINHSRLKRISYDGVEGCYELFTAGKHWGGAIARMPEPFRSGQQELGVKATYAIPILIKEKYWGVVGLDFCHQARLLKDSEIAILKTAANCIGGAITRDAILREQETVKHEISLEKQKTTVLEERDQLLCLAANTAKTLLDDRDLENAIAIALKLVGEGIDTDRVVVMEHYDDPLGKSLGYLKMLYEWHSPNAVSQLYHPVLQQVSYAGIEDWYVQLANGKAMGGVVDELSEPLRSGQLEIGVKSTYAIPVTVDGKYWGILAVDDCRSVKQRNETEFSILKTTAACIGSAIQQKRIDREKEQIERSILLEQQRVSQLEKYNQVLQQRDRILEATAKASNVLLTGNNLDEAINGALQIIGESIDTDRIAIMENFDNSADSSLPYWKVTYEWDSAYVISQLDCSEVGEGDYEGIEAWYELFNQGQTISCQIKDMPEPFWSKMARIGVKTSSNVPIIIEGRYWGCIGIDDCQKETYRSEAELSILKTAAACIGSAIQRDRTQKATLKIEQERAQQLANLNVELQQTVDSLENRDRILEASASAASIISTEEDFASAINKALQIIGEGIDTDRVLVMEHSYRSSERASGYVQVIYEWDSAYAISQIDRPEVKQVSWDGIEDWYGLMRQGKWAGGAINELPEPFRSKMKLIDVKSTYAIPILVEGKYWGMLGIDNCRVPTKFNEAEISILKTAAACIGGAIARERSRQAHLEAEQAIFLEREKAVLEQTAQLIESNKVLKLRDRWLEATANAANKLLKITDLELGINAALKVLGESLSCDRVTVLQHIEDPNRKHQEFVRTLNEWSSPGIVPQISHSEFNEVSSAGIEGWFAKLKTGDWIGGTIDELKEPFRSSQIALEVKATYSVPIFVNSVYWGAIGIDFCRKSRRLTAPEIAVFKTAASCIGSAIYRRQIQQQKEQAEIAVLDERNRMAREIHDTLAQAFTGISLQLEAAKNVLFIQPETALERLLQAKNLAKEGIVEARRSVRALRPEALEFSDLPTALDRLVDKMMAGTEITARVLIEGKMRSLDSEIEVNLFRIAQEAITNILRHAEATEAIVQLIYEP